MGVPCGDGCSSCVATQTVCVLAVLGVASGAGSRNATGPARCVALCCRRLCPAVARGQACKLARAHRTRELGASLPLLAAQVEFGATCSCAPAALSALRALRGTQLIVSLCHPRRAWPRARCRATSLAFSRDTATPRPSPATRPTHSPPCCRPQYCQQRAASLGKVRRSSMAGRVQRSPGCRSTTQLDRGHRHISALLRVAALAYTCAMRWYLDSLQHDPACTHCPMQHTHLETLVQVHPRQLSWVPTSAHARRRRPSRRRRHSAGARAQQQRGPEHVLRERGPRAGRRSAMRRGHGDLCVLTLLQSSGRMVCVCVHDAPPTSMCTGLTRPHRCVIARHGTRDGHEPSRRRSCAPAYRRHSRRRQDAARVRCCAHCCAHCARPMASCSPLVTDITASAAA